VARYRPLLAELLGTFTLVFVGSLSILAAVSLQAPLQVGVALGFGLALLAGLYAFGELSGGHFNPAVSLAMFMSRRLSASDLVGYWLAQLAGAVAAALAVCVAFSTDDVASTVTGTGASTAWEGLWLEILLTAVFVAVILQSTRSERVRGSALVAIPLTLVAIHLAAIPFSGASVNPARSFGPALVGGEWGDFWIYVVGPLVGGALASLLHGALYGPYEEVVEVDVVEVTTA
jgi:aquaporin Z